MIKIRQVTKTAGSRFFKSFYRLVVGFLVPSSLEDWNVWQVNSTRCRRQYHAISFHHALSPANYCPTNDRFAIEVPTAKRETSWSTVNVMLTQSLFDFSASIYRITNTSSRQGRKRNRFS
jgi:hypothetical protein